MRKTTNNTEEQNNNNNFDGGFFMRTNTVINQEVFNKAVVAELEKVYAVGYSIQINEIIKNNDTTLYGLTIMEGNISISPSIYLNEYFEVYKDGRTMNRIVNELIEIYENNKRPNIETAVTDIVDFDKIKNQIVIKLVNREKNTQFLKETPFVPFCDLAIIYNIIVPYYEGSATITVKNNILKDYWKLEANDLLELALENSKRLQPAKIQSMEEILREMFAKNFANQMGADSDMFSKDELDVLFQE